MRKNKFLIIMFLMLISYTAISGKELRFDFGMPPTGWIIPDYLKDNLYAQIYGGAMDNGKVNQGFIPIHPWSMYDKNIGYGWLPNGSSFHGRPYLRNDILTSLYYCQENYSNYEMVYDGLCIYSDKIDSFRIDLAPAKYLISFYLGDLNMGESRKDMTIRANGKIIINKQQTLGGQVKRVPCLVDVASQGLVLSFESTAQLSICGLEISTYTQTDTICNIVQNTNSISLEIAPRTPGDSVQKVNAFPETINNKEIANSNIKRYILEENAKLADAKEKIRLDGIFGTSSLNTPIQKNSTATQIYATMYGDVSRVVSLDTTLDLNSMVSLLKNTGIDLINIQSPVVLRKYHAGGLQVSSGVHAESLPSGSGVVEMQQLLKKDGTLTQLDGFFSIHSSATHTLFRNSYEQSMLTSQHDVDSIFVDEPRGMTYISGKLGDYSASSQAAFTNWCNQQNLPAYAVNGIPRPAWNDPFYAFYIFRLESVPLFLKSVTSQTCIENKKLFAGNGDISPGNLNHSTYFPPFNARKGIVPCSWSYTEPYLAKLSGEAMKAAQVYGANGMVFTRVGSADEATDRQLGLAALSSRCKALGPREGHSFRLFLEFSKIAESLQSSEHTTGLYFYWPQSLVYPDLINWNTNVGDQWNSKAKYLYDNNIDYKISYNASLSPGSMLLYYTPSPVLNQDEINSLKSMLSRGATLLYVAPTMPLKPDGSSYGATLSEVFGAGNVSNIISFSTFPTRTVLANLAASRNVPLNVNISATKPITTYEFIKDNGQKLILIINRSSETTTCTIPFDTYDYFTNEKMTSSLQIKGGLFKLLKR